MFFYFNRFILNSNNLTKIKISDEIENKYSLKIYMKGGSRIMKEYKNKKELENEVNKLISLLGIKFL